MSSANQAPGVGAATSGNGGDGLLSHSLLLGERLYFFSRLRFLAAAGILTGVPDIWQYIIKGLVIICAVALDRYRLRHGGRT